MGNKRKKIDHEEVVNRFAEKLRELRTGHGMTQAELAEAAEVTATYISKLESKGAAPGIDLVYKLAMALGVNIAELLPDESPNDADVVARDQAEKLFAALLKVADQQTFSLLNPFLALLVESAGKRV